MAILKLIRAVGTPFVNRPFTAIRIYRCQPARSTWKAAVASLPVPINRVTEPREIRSTDNWRVAEARAEHEHLDRSSL
jgi:hypothetical protein